MITEGTIKDQGQEFAIDKLLAEFHFSVESTALSPVKFQQLLAALKSYNPAFESVYIEGASRKIEVLVNVVAGIYAPLIHGYTSVVVENIQTGKLPNTVIAPPRDALPLANSLKAQAKIKGVEVNILYPHVNRNTAGIANNQKGRLSGKSPHLELLFDQVNQRINGLRSCVELETGIYGTTSLIMADALKKRGITKYYPMKFYGLGPNLSFVHAVLSDGKEWVAEKAETKGLVDSLLISQLMVLLDTMEELGMEKMYKSVENLQINTGGDVEAVVVPVSTEELAVATATNLVITQTAEKYSQQSTGELFALLNGVTLLMNYSQQGLPLTLKEPIPAMDSKHEHFERVRESRLFDYPDLKL